ncbi:hypothetical protein B9N64_01050 [Campylobacter concisus]|uniref:dynamin family protein n=1 Tax=Campylobacter concisus TaxID=199 RepID=UPI000B3D623D|nr:dynamin family protein [Campylobacter concisus]OUT15935.1 hypothetical protein B9N64_01050 [Campylobacter concisus]
MKTKQMLQHDIEQLEEYFKEYPDQDSTQKLGKIKSELKSQQYKIAVVANMSAGKSTFINALFGADILPTSTKATTDCATYIFSKEGIQKRAVIYFSDGKETIEIKENLADEIKQYAKKDEDCEYDKYKNVEKIELYYPFKCIKADANDELEIIFIDTPGPNSNGTDYSQKHKDQTRNVLREANLALFLFDYGQAQANLTSDEQGLWHTVKAKCENDKNFKVLFILNKIDEAFDDNFMELKNVKDESELRRLKKEVWFKNEEQRMQEIKKAASNHGINDADIYPVSSIYELLHRNASRGFDDKKKLLRFKEDYFEEIFDKSEWESRLITYLGFDKLEKDINELIMTNFLNNFLQAINSEIQSIYLEQKEKLQRNIAVLQKPKEEAEQKVKVAQNFLEHDAQKLQSDLNKHLQTNKENTILKLKKAVKNQVQKTMLDKTDKIAKKTMVFVMELMRGSDFESAKKVAKDPVTYSNVNLEKEEICDSREDKTDNFLKFIQDYTGELLDECKANYLDIKPEVEEICFGFRRFAIDKFAQTKDILNQQLSQALDIELDTANLAKLNLASITETKISVSRSVLSSEHIKKRTKTIADTRFEFMQDWGLAKKIFGEKEVPIQDEKYVIKVKGEELKSMLDENIKGSTDKFLEQEISQYEGSIEKYAEDVKSIFTNFRRNKILEIDELKRDLQESAKKLKENQIKLKKLNLNKETK